jgi:hypothetical protein
MAEKKVVKDTFCVTLLHPLCCTTYLSCRLRNRSATFGVSPRAVVVMSLTDGPLADVDSTGAL